MHNLFDLLYDLFFFYILLSCLEFFYFPGFYLFFHFPLGFQFYVPVMLIKLRLLSLVVRELTLQSDGALGRQHR